MISKRIHLVLASVLSVWSVSAQAADLVQAYNDAEHHDPVFKAAYAEWMASQQSLPIARSAYLPQLIASVEVGEGQQDYADGGPKYTNIHAHEYDFSLTQDIFDWGTIEQIKEADDSVKAAHANYANAKQQLLVRVSNAYFSVLSYLAKYHASLANRDALEEQYYITKHKYEVGTVSAAQLASAAANYDYARAELIESKHNVELGEESLANITGKHYKAYQGLGRELELKSPKPADISVWVAQAAAHNYNVKVYEYNVSMAKHNLYAQYAGAAPVVSVTADYKVNRLDNIDGVDSSVTGRDTFDESSYDYNQKSVTLNASLPVFQGGRTYYSSKQARYQYEQAKDDLDNQRDNVVTSTRKDYLAIVADIAYIQADHQALISANQAYADYREAYKVGNVSFEALLDSIHNVFQSRSTYYTSRYRYLLDMLSLKADVARLSETDIKQVNAMLKQKTSLDGKTDLRAMENVKQVPVKQRKPKKAEAKQKSAQPAAKATDAKAKPAPASTAKPEADQSAEKSKS